MVVFVVLNTSLGCISGVFKSEKDAAFYVASNTFYSFITTEHTVV